jgi:hypothetical protein
MGLGSSTYDTISNTTYNTPYSIDRYRNKIYTLLTNGTANTPYNAMVATYYGSSIGYQGNKGNAGPQGLIGNTGPDGMQGAQGAQGTQGPKGPIGPQGITGITGVNGPAGQIGTRGMVGNTGYDGPKGDTGLPWYVTVKGVYNSDYMRWKNGKWSVESNSVFLGADAGSIGTGENTIAIGGGAGIFIQGTGSIAVGDISGARYQGLHSVAIGKNSGSSYQGDYSVSIGPDSLARGYKAVSLGYSSSSPNDNQIVIGTPADTTVVPGTLFVPMNADNTNSALRVAFSKSATGQNSLYTSSIHPFTYNPYTSTLTAYKYEGSSSISATSVSLGNGFIRAPLSEMDCIYAGNLTGGGLDLAGGQTTGELQIGTAHTTGEINIGNGTYWNGGSINICSGAFSGATGCSVNLMTGANAGLGTVNIGGSLNTTVNVNSRALFSDNILTSTSTPPSVPNHLGYVQSISLSALADIVTVPGPTDVLNVPVNNVIIPCGTYLVIVYLYLNHLGSSSVSYSVSVSTSSKTMSVPYETVYFLGGDTSILHIAKTITISPSARNMYVTVQCSSAVSGNPIIDRLQSIITMARVA